MPTLMAVGISVPPRMMLVRSDACIYDVLLGSEVKTWVPKCVPKRAPKWVHVGTTRALFLHKFVSTVRSFRTRLGPCLVSLGVVWFTCLAHFGLKLDRLGAFWYFFGCVWVGCLVDFGVTWVQFLGNVALC